MEKIGLTLDDYIIEEKLGSGSYGRVYRAKRKSDPLGKTIALKVITIRSSYRNKKLIEMTKSEVDKLKKLSLPECNLFVICYYDSYYDEKNNNFLIEMELIEGQDMDKYVKKLRNEKSEEMVYFYLLLIAKDVLQGLKYTHSKNIIHNDIKMTNIRIDTNNVPRIIDYGLACNMAPYRDFCKNDNGTPLYISPETIEDNIRYPSSDLWALGVTLYFAVTKKYPFIIPKKAGLRQFFEIVINNEPAKLDTSNEQLNVLVNKLLVKDYTNRLTVDQGLEMLNVINDPRSKPAPENPSLMSNDKNPSPEYTIQG